MTMRGGPLIGRYETISFTDVKSVRGSTARDMHTRGIRVGPPAALNGDEIMDSGSGVQSRTHD